MSRTFSYFSSTIGRKQLVGLTGLGLSLFVLSHMLGNLLIFVSPQAYNEYGHALISNPFIYLIDAGLVAMFVMHLGIALKLSLENASARKEKYAVSSSGDKGTSLITKTMWHQGIVILVFTVYHLITFKYGTVYEITYDGVMMRDLHGLVIEVFQSPLYVVGYSIALVVLGVHLSHGVSSSLQSLGFHHPKYTPKLKLIGRLYAFVVAVGFITQPFYVFFVHQ